MDAYLVYYGPECRIFFSNRNDTNDLMNGIVIRREVESLYLKEYITAFNLSELSFNDFPQQHSKWWERLKRVIGARNRILGTGNYRWNSIEHRSRKMTDFILGLNLSFILARSLCIKTMSQYVKNDFVQSIRENNIKRLFLAGCSTPPQVSIAASAHKAGCNVFLYINTWKQFYINGYIPKLIKKVFVWNEHMRKMYLNLNKHMKEECFEVIGNPRFTSLRNHISKTNSKSILNKYNISKTKYILYTAVNPTIYNDEPKIVKLIINELKKLYGDEAPAILIKTNPMDSCPDRWEVINTLTTVGIIYSEWEWNSQDDFNLPSLDSEQLYYDLLHNANLVMNVASTVCIEAVLCKKHVVTIGFDETGSKLKTLTDQADADFYRPMLDRNDVALCDNISSLGYILDNLKKIQAGRNVNNIVRVDNGSRMNTQCD